MRIAALIGNLNREHGGAQQLLYNVLSRLPDQYTPVVYHLFGPGTFREDFEDAGVEVRHLGASSHYDVLAFGRFVQWMRRDPPDLLHTNSPATGAWGRIVARLAGVPAVLSVEQNTHDAFGAWPRLVNGLTLPLADAVVTVSRTVHKSLARWERALLPADTKVRVIHNGVDVEHFTPASEDQRFGGAPTVGTLGRLVEAKGYDRLLEAWPSVLEVRPQARLRIVGDGRRKKDLESLVEQLRVADSVTFTGYVADPLSEFHRFDLAVFPSRWEGLPLSLAQAMAAGVPVVASDIGPNRTLVGQAGILVPGTDRRRLAKSISDLLADADRRTHFATEGRRRIVRQFSAKRIAKSYEALYRELMAR